MTQLTEVRVKDLKKGDVLASTKYEVIIAPMCGVFTPKGSVTLFVINSTGFTLKKTWDGNTFVKIIQK